MPSVECGFPGNRDLLCVAGPQLGVRIGFDASYQAGHGRPTLPETNHQALVDTGADESCIDAELAVALDLPIVDRGPIAGVGGVETVNYHLAQILIPALNWVIIGRFSGVHLTAGGQPHRALIGRIFLRDARMVYDGRSGGVQIQIAGPPSA